MWPGTPSTRIPGSPPALAEIERRLRWRFAPLVIFLAMMISLGAAAAISILAPIRIVRGIPDDPEARAAFALVRAGEPPGLEGLRFTSELTGEAAAGGARPVLAVAERALALLAAAEKRSPLDPRLPTAIAHLDLVRRMFAHAERGYRRALALAPHHGEARLGLGVALALRADTEADALVQRSLRLQAVAQLAAVPGSDPVHEEALFDRVTLLARVGRRTEAERLAHEYRRRYGSGAWSDSLNAKLAAAS